VALAWDEPTSATAAGSTRWVLEHRLGLPVTAVRTVRLASADLSRFDVVILPAGDGYGGVLDQAGVQNLKRFVEGGGVLVAIAGAVSYLADPEVALLSLREEKRAAAPRGDTGAAQGAAAGAAASGGDAGNVKDVKSAQSAQDAPDGEGGEDSSSAEAGAGGGTKKSGPASGPRPGTVIAAEAAYLAAIAPDDASPDSVPGALVRAVPDADHWLTVGVAPMVNVMVQGSAIFSPLRLDQGVNALRFAAAGDLVASGYLWDENRAQLAWKPFTVVEQHGRGLVIGFTADPTFRGVLAGCDVLLLNAVVRAPAHVER
jgi:hypothetical protein